MIRLALTALALIALASLGCAETEQAPSTPAPIKTADVHTQDEADAVAAETLFVSAWERRDEAQLGAALSADWLRGSGQEWLTAFGGTASVRLVNLDVERSRPLPRGAVMVRATLDVTPAGGNSAWQHGPNERVIQFVREDGAWKVAGIGG